LDFKTEADAKVKHLIEITEWLRNIPTEQTYLEKFESRLRDQGRTTMLVMRDDKKKIALFANSVTCTSVQAELPKGRIKSKSGKYYNIRHLCECVFAENRELDLVKFKNIMQCEFPDSAPVRNGSYMNHFKFYRHKLVVQRQFQYIPLPEWATK
jgi:hypothetical protein